ALVGLGDRHRALFLLGSERRKVSAPYVRLEQDLVREHVELLLRLALHVVGARRAEAVGKRPLVDARADRLAGAGDGLDEQPEIGVDELLVTLSGNQELRECDAPHGAYST